MDTMKQTDIGAYRAAFVLTVQGKDTQTLAVLEVNALYDALRHVYPDRQLAELWNKAIEIQKQTAKIAALETSRYTHRAVVLRYTRSDRVGVGSLFALWRDGIQTVPDYF